MNAARLIYKNAPKLIPVPEEFRKKDIEVIFLPIDREIENTDITKFYGAPPDLPDIKPQK